MISTANITMQFGAKPLFENISVKFGDGNRYGLIGANGCGKSTFMKILDGSLEPSAGNVSVTPNERLGPSAWKEVLAMEARMRKQRKDELYRKQEQVDALINFAIWFVIFGVGAALLFGLFYFWGSKQGRW